jgi:hypothetical protein
MAEYPDHLSGQGGFLDHRGVGPSLTSIEIKSGMTVGAVVEIELPEARVAT